MLSSNCTLKGEEGQKIRVEAGSLELPPSHRRPDAMERLHAIDARMGQLAGQAKAEIWEIRQRLHFRIHQRDRVNGRMREKDSS